LIICQTVGKKALQNKRTKNVFHSITIFWSKIIMIWS
jgi:hypothetical protein